MRMSKVFVDSNIWIYAFIEAEKEKEKRANVLSLLNEVTKKNKIVVSIQVINEFHWILQRKYGIDEVTIRGKVQEGIMQIADVVSLGLSTYETARDVRAGHNVSFWDSLIVASALEHNCTDLYSEDMQHNKLLEGNLRIINPFATS